MSLTPKQQKKLAKVKEIEDDGVLTLANDLVELEEKIEESIKSVNQEVSTIKEIAENTAKQKGEKGDDYVLTDTDRQDIADKVQVKVPTVEEIAKKVKVPIVEKVIEKVEVIKEQPLHFETIKEITNNIENKDTGEQIVTKINLQDTLIKAEKVEGIKDFKKDVKTIKDYDIPTLQNRTQLLNQMISGLSRDLESQDTLQEVTDNGATTTNAITTGGLTTPYVESTTSYTPTGSEAIGTRYWNAVKGTTSLKRSANSTLDDGQELGYYVKASGAISNGQLVQFSGYQGDHYTAKVCVPAEVIAFPRLVMGIATEDIANGEYGNVTAFGEVTMNTTGWVVDDKLYFDNSTGQLTNVVPNAPERMILVGVVVKEETSPAAANGRVLTRITWGMSLEDLDNVDGADPDTTGDLLTYDQPTNTWERGAYNITDYLTTLTAGSTYAKLDGSNHPFTYVKTPKIYPNADSTTALQILKADGTTSIMDFDTTNGRVGIGITPNGTNLHIRGETTTNNYIQIWGASGASGNLTSLALVKSADTSGEWVFTSYLAGAGTSVAPKIHFGVFDATPVNGAKFTMDVANGRLGIGITSPTSPLHISTTVTTPINVVSSDTNTVLIRSTKGANAATAQVQLQTVNRSMVFASTDQASGVAGWYDITAGAWRMAIIHGSGNVDIGGGIATSYKLNVAGTTGSNQFLSDSGSAGAPAYTSKTDPNTGAYFGSADTYHIATGGGTRTSWDASGHTAQGTTTSSAIFARFQKSQTQLTSGYTISQFEGTHTLNADNTSQYSGAVKSITLNTAGFNQTTAISSGGAAAGGYSLVQLASTPATGTTTAIVGYRTSVRNTGAATLTNAISYLALPVLNSGAGSTTNAFGFYSSAMTAATNNYGFYGLNTAATGRWNLYMAGDAQNYLAGNLGLGVTTPAETLELKDAGNIKFQTTTGTKIGTATAQKIGFWNATPIVQPTTAVTAATFAANTSGIIDDTATFDGYTIGQVVKALRNAGLLA